MSDEREKTTSGAVPGEIESERNQEELIAEMCGYEEKDPVSNRRRLDEHEIRLDELDRAMTRRVRLGDGVNDLLGVFGRDLKTVREVVDRLIVRRPKTESGIDVLEVVDAIFGEGKPAKSVGIPISLPDVYDEFERVRVRLDDLEVLKPGRVALTGKIHELEMCVGMRNHDIAKLEKELKVVRATRDRAVSESSSRGALIEELEEQISDRDQTIAEFGERIEAVRETRNKAVEDRAETDEHLARLTRAVDAYEDNLNKANERGVNGVRQVSDLQETVRRKDAQIAGFVGEVRDLREKLEKNGYDAPNATYAHSAETIVELVLASTAISDGGIYVRDVETRRKLIDEIERAFRVAARLPESAEYAIFCETVVDLEQNGEFRGSDTTTEEEFDDLPTAEARFDELSNIAAEVRLALILRRFRRSL